MVIGTDQESEIHHSVDISRTFGCLIKCPVNAGIEIRDGAVLKESNRIYE